MGILGNRALDIDVSEKEFCLILGYLATPGRVGFIEAQIPEDKVEEFTNNYSEKGYYPITQGETSGGNQMKQGCQFRIYFNNVNNCPCILKPYLGKGNGTYCKRINKGKFIEKIIENFGFRFGHNQDVDLIREKVSRIYPQYMEDFDKGFNS